MLLEIHTEARAVELTEAELGALLAAAAWYAKYHQRIIVDDSDDDSARAVADREHHHLLREGLSKLGVALSPPSLERAAS
jgi:hypothetical protein